MGEIADLVAEIERIDRVLGDTGLAACELLLAERGARIAEVTSLGDTDLNTMRLRSIALEQVSGRTRKLISRIRLERERTAAEMVEQITIAERRLLDLRAVQERPSGLIDRLG